MKKKITVKRKTLATNESDVLYAGPAEYEKTADCIKCFYQEKTKEADVFVAVSSYRDHLELQRTGETSSTLMYEKGKKTKGVLSSPYGDLEIDLFTKQYFRQDHVITLEYEIYNGEEQIGGYRIIWNIQED